LNPNPPMTQPKPHRLGDLQFKIMKILWTLNEASVAEIHAELGKQKDLAYTTVATMLRKMEARELVSHRSEGRTYIFRPEIAEDEVSRGMIDHLIDRLFEGSLSSAVNHLLTTRDVSPAELKQLEQLIAKKKRGGK
jgi:BlaI family penicillinase repressor